MVSAFITFTWHVNLFAIDVVNQALHCQCTCVGAGSRELCLKTYTSAHIFDTLVTFQPPAIRRGLRREKSYKSNNPMLQDFEINSVNKCFIGTFKANIIQANKHNICKTRANGAFEFCQEKTSPSPATSGKGFNFTKIIPFILDFIFVINIWTNCVVTSLYLEFSKLFRIKRNDWETNNYQWYDDRPNVASLPEVTLVLHKCSTMLVES